MIDKDKLEAEVRYSMDALSLHPAVGSRWARIAKAEVAAMKEAKECLQDGCEAGSIQPNGFCKWHQPSTPEADKGAKR